MPCFISSSAVFWLQLPRGVGAQGASAPGSHKLFKGFDQQPGSLILAGRHLGLGLISPASMTSIHPPTLGDHGRRWCCGVSVMVPWDT